MNHFECLFDFFVVGTFHNEEFYDSTIPVVYTRGLLLRYYFSIFKWYSSRMMHESLETVLHMAETAEGNENFFAANHFYIVALNKITSTQKSPERDEKIKTLKKKIRETGLRIEMQKFSFEVEGTSVEDILKRYGERIDIPTAPEAIDAYAKGIAPFPLKAVQMASQQNTPVMLALVTTHVQDENGDQLKTDREDGSIFFWETYRSMLSAYTIREIAIIGEILSEKGHFTFENLGVHIEAKANILTESEKKKITVALHRYFEGDHISALHVLVPTFEAFFLRVSSGPSATLSDISHRVSKEGVYTKTRVLGEDFLDHAETIALWGGDLCGFIKAFLFSEMGFRVRHKVCHGEIDAEACDKTTCQVMIFLFLHILSQIKI